MGERFTLILQVAAEDLVEQARDYLVELGLDPDDDAIIEWAFNYISDNLKDIVKLEMYEHFSFTKDC